MILSKFFTAFGIICLVLAGTLFWQRNNPKRVAFKSTPMIRVDKSKKVRNLPTGIRIEKIGVDLPILPSKVYGQKWETTSLGVSWLDISPVPGEKGNSILYGHNWSNLLGSLYKISPGDNLEIKFSDSSIKRFVVESIAFVSPTNITVLNQTDDKRITIYTCAGFFDEKRFVVTGLLLTTN